MPAPLHPGDALTPSTVTTPIQVERIDQRYLIEALGGPQNVQTYLDYFPDELYDKSLDSHLVRFLYVMLGPSGLGSLRKNHLRARLKTEAANLELYDLDTFYGAPFQFGRLPDETYRLNPSNFLSQAEWESIRAKDARYRNRILDFFAGGRAGNTPLGMYFVARSGLGHEVEVVENYRALFDEHSDDPLGFPYVGKTRLTNEIIVIPRPETPKAEVQELMIVGSPTGGNFRLTIGADQTSLIPWNATALQVEQALSLIINISYVIIEGGPLPNQVVSLKFIGPLAGSRTNLGSVNLLTGGSSPQIIITPITTYDANADIHHIDARSQYHLQSALDRIKPVTIIPTFFEGKSTHSRANWTEAAASSEFDEMLKYVTGSGAIRWPPRDELRWVEQGVEHQAPHVYNDLQYHYKAFHRITAIDAYNETAEDDAAYLDDSWASVKQRYRSEHSGSFESHHAALFSYLRNETRELTARMALADYEELLTFDQVGENTGPLINGIYPVEYTTLPGAPEIRYLTNNFWASVERTKGAEFLEIDLGIPQAVNYLTFKIPYKPIDIAISYDLLGLGGNRSWWPVTVNHTISDRLFNQERTDQYRWRNSQFFISNGKSEMLYTRYLRIKFTRRIEPFFLVSSTGTQYPWSIDVRDLRVGRVVANQ